MTYQIPARIRAPCVRPSQATKAEKNRARFSGLRDFPRPCNRVRKITDDPPHCQGRPGGHHPLTAACRLRL
jgi:hypothetical protein